MTLLYQNRKGVIKMQRYQQTQPNKPTRLPTIVLDNGKTYFIDDRLKQFRNISNPHDFIDFEDYEKGGE